MRIAGLATILGREELVKQVIAAILPQVDVLHVCFSGYLEIPAWAQSIKKLHASVDPMNILHDCAKFQWVARYPDACYFSVDDDINYPSDYVSVMLDWLEKCNREAVISTHGRNYDYTERTVYSASLKEPRFYPILGTGACAFHTAYLTFAVDDFLEPMANADYMLALKIASQRKRGFVIAKPANWITQIDTPNPSTSCGQQRKHNPYVIRKRQLVDDRLREFYRNQSIPEIPRLFSDDELRELYHRPIMPEVPCLLSA
jgi:hypothetical protein